MTTHIKSINQPGTSLLFAYANRSNIIVSLLQESPFGDDASIFNINIKKYDAGTLIEILDDYVRHTQEGKNAGFCFSLYERNDESIYLENNTENIQEAILRVTNYLSGEKHKVIFNIKVFLAALKEAISAPAPFCL